MMDEVEKERFAGPYDEIPYKDTYVQSPVGLVPKDDNKTRLIFHLSYKFKNGNESINYWTPDHLCSVKYNDLDQVVKECIGLMKKLGIRTLFFSKSDLKSAFCILGIRPEDCCLLIMKAWHPVTKKWYYFVDKCLPFGASISCAHFQSFSNALKEIVQHFASRALKHCAPITNYLDDFLFIFFHWEGCDHMVVIFLDICQQIRFPVSLDKTEWSTMQIIFLGMLLDGRLHTLSISNQRRELVLNMVKKFADKRKATIKELQQLAGHLNFVNKAVVPGRAFTRRMYSKFSGSNILNNQGLMLKPHHHVKLDNEFRLDCCMWRVFLEDLDSTTRPFIDLSDTLIASNIGFYSDASANPLLGYGAIYGNSSWIFGQW